MRDLLAPVESLAVEIGQGGEGTGGEETVTNILDGPLHAAFVQSRQLHAIQSIRNRFESLIPSTRFAAGPSVLLSQRNCGARIG
jgi:hypothetical protein